MAFGEIVGHRALLGLISRAVEHGSVPPSLLFVGPEGTGKRLAACALAQTLNCGSPVRAPAGGTAAADAFEIDACGRCHTCQRIARGSFADVLTIAPGENGSITVDQVREAIGQAAYRPFEGRRRVVIIDDAERLVPEAQNALLKTLEEPPDSSQFVLVTTRPDTLLATVRSRCQRLSFGQLGVADISELLGRTHGYDERVARAAAASAGGSIGRALRLASGELTAARDAAVTLLEVVASGRDAKARLEGAKGFLAGKSAGKTSAAVRQELMRRLRALTSLLRDVELVGANADRQSLANADLQEGLSTLARTFGGARGVDAFAAVGAALDAADRNVNPKVIVDWLACEL